ncbi:MAG: hypothetical protein JO020_23070 [Chloroflexi bacterium]|nr:hypothetical protein [Chloroflexota bacterium]MBV9897057.1 hypothetical protein [Chloroflexota bacterium]
MSPVLQLQRARTIRGRLITSALAAAVVLVFSIASPAAAAPRMFASLDGSCHSVER